jgi:hypothetical protein
MDVVILIENHLRLRFDIRGCHSHVFKLVLRRFQIRSTDLSLVGAEDSLHVLERFSSCLQSSSEHSLGSVKGNHFLPL